MSRKAKFRLILLFLLLGVSGYLGYTLLKERDPWAPYYAAEKSYQHDGLEREKVGDVKGAALGYDQACVLLEHAYHRLNGWHGLDEQSIKTVAGKILYLKSKALRDRHYARAAAEGKPLPLTTDTVTGETYRNVLAILDVKDREEAVGSLRGAATLFTANDLDVQFDALRLSLMMSPIEWDHVERHSKAILALKPEDSRSKYLLAKIEFEQPEQRTNRPVPPAKRSRERIKNASRLIDEVRADPKFPTWRTEYLRASIHHWLMKHPAAGRDKKPGKELEILDKMLFDPKGGAIARIRNGEGLEHLGAWDSEGILGLYAMASDVALEKMKLEPADPKVDPAKREEVALLRRVFDETLAFCEAKLQKQDPAFPPSLIAATLLKSMVNGQAVLSVHQPKQWQEGLSLLKTVTSDEFKADRCDPFRVAQFAELLMREASLVARRGGMGPQSEKIRAEAKSLLNDGFEYGKRHGFNDQQMLPFHLLAANVGFLNGDSIADVSPHLAALRRTELPQALATALVIEGAYDEREGRLLKARDKIEKAVKIDGGDEEIRGHAMLVSIYMSIGRPDYALINLFYVKKVLAEYETLSNLEREWMANFIGTPHNYDALTVIARLENARQSIANYRAKHPEAKTHPPGVVKEDEDKVKELFANELVSPAGPGFIARVAWVHHLTVTNRRKEAEDFWQTLNVAFPDRIELLTLKIGLMEREAAESGDARKKQSLIPDVDRQILEFIKTHPANQSARLYYAIWLAQTRRSDQAIAYLKDIIDGTPITPEVRRVATAIMLTAQTDTSPIALARHLPRNPQIDDVLLDLNRKTGTPRTEIKNAFVRHESVGLSRIMQADDLFLAGQYGKAAEAFAAAFDFTRVRAFAQQGLLRSVFALASEDPAAAMATIERINEEFPDEPTTLLAQAYVLIIQDKIGSPGDDWKTRQTMASTLNHWEKKLTDDGVQNPASIALTKSEFWLRANRVDIALDQAKLALKHDPKSPTALAACVAIILDDPSRDPRPELAGYLETLAEVGAESLPAQRLLGRAAEMSQKWDDAIRIFEQVLSKSPYDRETYARLINDLEARNSTDQALKWIQAWRDKTPNDSQAVAAEIRVLCRANKKPQAIAVADLYLKQTESIGNKRAENIKDPADKTRFIDDARCLPQIELARGFVFGGDLDEAQRRLLQLPKTYAESPQAQDLLSDIYLRNKEWSKAEAILEAIVQKNPRNLTALNNLVYVLAVHSKNPARARTLLLTAMKSNAGPLSVRATDRLSAQFLHTIGVVYATLAEPQYGRELLQFLGTASSRFPNDPRVELYTGYGYELIGESARARDHYERAIKKSDHPSLTTEERVSLLADATTYRDRVEKKLKAANR